jgi:hypothetical protein
MNGVCGLVGGIFGDFLCFIGRSSGMLLTWGHNEWAKKVRNRIRGVCMSPAPFQSERQMKEK